MDDRTAGLVLRALRRRRRWRQSDLAARAGVSQSTVSRAERGFLEDLSLRITRSMFATLGSRVGLAPRWNGAELERLIDEEHAVVVAAVAKRLDALGWTVELEVTYSEFGERGSIDVLGLRPDARAIAVIEVKTDIPSSEAVGRKLDEKARLAPGIVSRRYGWVASSVGRVLVMPESMRLRRLVVRHDVIGRMFPVDAIRVRRWLRQPTGAMAGLWFLSDIAPQTSQASRRVTAPRQTIEPSVAGASGTQIEAQSAPDRAPERSKSQRAATR